MVVWQPGLFYNWHLDRRPVFTRVTGVVRAMLMLGGLIPFGLNPMSIFSYPLELGLATGFTNPRYSVEDIIFQVRALCQTRAAVPIKLLPVPVISGPTIGVSYLDDLYEWQLQLRRWAIGSAEAAHYFAIHWRGAPLFAGLRWLTCFLGYYAVLLCCAAPLTITAALPLPWSHFPSIEVGPFRFSLQYGGLAALALQYVAFTAAFVMDRRAVKLLTVDDKIHPIRNLLHLLLSPVVMLAYGVVACYAVMRFVVKGKSDAGHVMAAKVGFAAKRAQGAPTEPMLPLDANADTGSEAPMLRDSFSVRSGSSGMLPHPYPVAQGESAIFFDSSPHAWPGDSPLAQTLPDLFRFGAFEFDPRKRVAKATCSCQV